MRHKIDMRIKVMLPKNWKSDSHWKVIHNNSLLIDANGELWTLIDQDVTHCVFARLVPDMEGYTREAH